MKSFKSRTKSRFFMNGANHMQNRAIFKQDQYQSIYQLYISISRLLPRFSNKINIYHFTINLSNIYINHNYCSAIFKQDQYQSIYRDLLCLSEVRYIFQH